MNRTEHFSYTCSQTGDSLTLVKVNLELDFEYLYSWMHEPHVAALWHLDKPYADLYAYFKNMLTNTNQELFMLSINNALVAYGEVYSVCHDRLANFYPSCPGDYGIHLLIGNPLSLGLGYSKLIVRGLSHYLFSRCDALRVLIEPSVEVKQLRSLERKLGFKNLGIIQLPEKMATLYAIEPYDFYKANPSRIDCIIHNWPIIHINFPSFPTDYAVSNWIKQLELLVTIPEPYVVITTFDHNYQFSQSARKEQMGWFKRNKKLLAQYCRGMLRVTNDADMISKLNKPAMKKNMPFQCIACQSVTVATQMAHELLKINIS